MNEAKPRLPSLRGVRRAAAVLLATVAAAPAIADEATPSPVMVRAGASWHHDSNVYRLPDEVPGAPLADDAGFASKSDRILTAYFLARLQRTLGQQRLFAEATHTVFRYERFTELDRDALEYRAAWDWRLTPWIGGTIDTRRTEALLGFETTRQRRPAINVTHTNRATVDAEPAPGWHLLGSVAARDGRIESGFPPPEPDYDETAREAGARYVTAAGNAISALYRRRDGSYENLFLFPGYLRSGLYTADETEMRLTWLPTAKSSVSGRLGRVDRQYDDAAFLDFSGYTGELAWSWSITGRLDFTAIAQHDIGPAYSVPSASYRVDETYSVMPVWRATNKVELRLLAYRTNTRYLDAFGSDESRRRDTIRGVRVAAKWNPNRFVTVSTILQREQRDSTDPFARFDDVMGGLDVSFSFRDFE